MAQNLDSLHTDCSQRANNLARLTFVWNVDQHYTQEGVNRTGSSWISKMNASYAERAKYLGLHGKAATDFVQQSVQKFIEENGPKSINLVSEWQFDNDGSSVLVNGRDQNSLSLVTVNEEYFGQGVGFSREVGGYHPSDPDVWTTMTRPVQVYKVDGDGT